MKEILGEQEIRAYLQRIGFDGDLSPDFSTLCALQQAHLQHVPYENLDVLYRRPFSLNIPALYDKIVQNRRGGYCFELNGLFAWLLRQLGYSVTERFGRCIYGEPLRYPMRRHRISIVELDDKRYVCDVGVGMPAPCAPLLLEYDIEQEINGEIYRIVRDPVDAYTVQVKMDGKFENFYSFEEHIAQPIDFYYAHYYCTTHPDSMFLQKTMVFMRTESNGKKWIHDLFNPQTGEKMWELNLEEGDQKEKISIQSESTLFYMLKKHFDICFE